MNVNKLNTEQNKLMIKMIEFYDRWKDSEFKVYVDTHYQSVLGSEISRWLSIKIDITEYSELDKKTLNSLREIYIIHQ